MHKKSCNQLLKILASEYYIDWNNQRTRNRMGSVAFANSVIDAFDFIKHKEQIEQFINIDEIGDSK